MLQPQCITKLPIPKGGLSPACQETETPEVGAEAFLSDISPRDKPWDEHRAQADNIQEHYREDAKWHGRYLRMEKCGQRLFFGWASENGDWKFKLQEAHFCRAPGCPICQWRRSLMWQSRFLKALPELQAKYPKARWVFLTLTVRNCPVEELGQTLDAMSEAWHRFSRRKEFRAVLGWVKAIEITKNHKTGYAHPHVHVLLMVQPSYFGKCYVTQARWTDLWQECLRVDYTPIVHVKAIKDNPEALKTAVFETLKYTLKPSDLADDKDWFLTAMAQLLKRRLVMTGGALKGILRENEEARDEELALLDGEGLGAENLIPFDWRRLVKRYQRSKG